MDRTPPLWPAHRAVAHLPGSLLVTPAEADGVQGGNTRLYKPDVSGVDVSPVKGSALFFRHGFGRDSVRHVGCQVSGAVSKYVARINVMYSV